MDLDRLDWWRVESPSGRSRQFRNHEQAQAHQAAVGGRIVKGWTWQVRYRDPDGNQRAKSFARRPDAERFAATTEADKLRGTWIDPKAGRRTFRAYAEEWRTIQIHQPRTAAKVEGDLRLHVYPVLGDLALARVRPTQVQAWVRGVTGKLAPSSVEVVYSYIATIMKAAVADDVIARSPCVGITLPAVDQARIVPWLTEWVKGLAEAVPARYRGLVVYTAATGVRQGEAFGLTLAQLRMLERQVDVDWQMQPVKGAGLALCRPKTKASRRTVPLGKVAAAALAAHLAEFPPVATDIVHRERDGTTTTAVEQLVFTNAAGRPLRASVFNEHVWGPGVEKAGLPPGSHMHELRHFYASLLIHHGESPKVVQERLGHASIVETMDTYGHLWPDSDDRTRQAVDEVLGEEERRPDAAADG
jgi:integrase